MVREALGEDAVSTDATTLASHGRDWTQVYPANPAAVAFPRSTEDVARLLKLANDHDIAIVPSGGRTGLAGGAVASHEEVVVSLDRMRSLGEVDKMTRTVHVQAGAVTKTVQDHCAPHGLMWPVDFASSGSSQIGGNIATNAGGVRVVRYGLTRKWVLGLQVVTMAGDVLELGGSLEKNNTGLDLRQLFIGTEGTLGVITEATLKLESLPGPTNVALLAVTDLQAALRVLEQARTTDEFSLLAFEYVADACIDVVTKIHGVAPPFAERSAAYVLVEAECLASRPDGTNRWLEKLVTDELIEDGIVASSAKQASQLWQLREGISESLTRTGFVHKNDVALPVRQLPAFTTALEHTLRERYPDFGVYIFGHLGDGNLHINIMKPDNLAQDEFLTQCHDTDEVLFTLVREHQGSISAEHGVGLLKKDFLHYTRSAAELELFRGVKRVFDPKGLLNPGKIID